MAKKCVGAFFFYVIAVYSFCAEGSLVRSLAYEYLACFCHAASVGWNFPRALLLYSDAWWHLKEIRQPFLGGWTKCGKIRYRNPERWALPTDLYWPGRCIATWRSVCRNVHIVPLHWPGVLARFSASTRLLRGIAGNTSVDADCTEVM